MAFDSRVIANRILQIASEKGIKLTIMQLLKLVYIAHGWWLTFSNGKPLTKDTAQAWRYGPVYPAVYNSFRANGSKPISTLASDPLTGLVLLDDIPKDVDSLLEQVVESYGKMHAFRLSDLTHEAGTPWSETSDSAGYYAPISNSLIKEHFDGLRK